ncbi:MAG: glutathione S-transferase [Rubrivivax sp.]
MALTLLGKASSINVRKVLWTLDELGLAYAREDWGSGFRDTREPGFLALNPNAMVPVLRDGNVVLWESNTICRYLAAREARSDLIGATPRERAAIEQWMDWQATELNNSWRTVFMGRVRGSAAHQDPDALRAGEAAWARHMRILDAQLARGGPYVCGERFTLADVVLGLSEQRWRLTPLDDRPALPAVDAWRARLALRPAHRRHVDNGLP